jgi:pyridoxal phosphate enzyme (YggS family)
MHPLADRLAEVRERMAAAARRAMRSPESVQLLPVSKTFGESEIRAAVALGLKRLGESRVQEIQRKHGPLADCGIDWVMIGHLQTNKVRQILPLVTEIQTLDRMGLAEALDQRLQREGRALDVLVQVKTSPEPSKYGLMPEELVSFVRTVARDMPTLRIRGLMTMAIHTQQEAAIRQCFRTLSEWRDRVRAEGIGGVDMERLSMGMSGDFEIAIEEGATEVRVGTAIFGPRNDSPQDYWPEQGG